MDALALQCGGSVARIVLRSDLIEVLGVTSPAAAELPPGRRLPCMMHTPLHPIATSFLVTLLCVLQPRLARADGCASFFDPVHEQWQLLGEPRQTAVISVEDGHETMLLGVEIENDATPERAAQLAWLTPIPAPAAQTSVDLLRGAPRFVGRNTLSELHSQLELSLILMSLTQLYPLPVLAFFMVGVAAPPLGRAATVHEQIERDGVELQLLSAPSASALEAHLTEIAIGMPEKAIAALGTYANDQSCFVLLRITDLVAYRRAIEASRFALGVMARFPVADGRGFFPLTASAAVPSELLQVEVFVLGMVREGSWLPAGTEISYHFGGADVGPEVTAALGVDLTQPRDYTRFVYLGPPRGLTHDIYTQPGASITARVASAILASELKELIFFALGLTLFLALSIIAAQIARLSWPRATRPSFGSTVALASANLLSVIGLAVAAYLYAKRQGEPGSRAFKYVAVTSVIFCALVGMVGLALQWSIAAS